MSVDTEREFSTPLDVRRNEQVYSQTYRMLAAIALENGDIEARQQYLEMAEMFDTAPRV